MAPRDPLTRVRQRPTPDLWGQDESMTLAEYIAVFHPLGPLTVSSLRTEIRRNRLLTAEVCGKLYVTPARVAALFEPQRRCPAAPKAPASTSGQTGPKSTRPQPGSSSTDRKRSAQAALQMSLAKLKSPSRSTSPASGRRQSRNAAPIHTAPVIPLRS